MDQANVPVWVAVALPIVTLVLGYVFSLITEAARDRRQSRRESQAREDERAAMRAAAQEAEERRRREFQRETLLELQEVLHDLGRAYGAEHHVDIMHGRETGSWHPKPMLSEEINKQGLEASQRSNILLARIDDVALRQYVQAMKDAGSRITQARSEPESNEAIAGSVEAFGAANQRIGDLLRQVY